MKFRFIIEGTYSVPDDEVFDTYGSTDPVECALIDLKAAGPEEVLAWTNDAIMSIEPAA